jgi:hypothetical protein
VVISSGPSCTGRQALAMPRSSRSGGSGEVAAARRRQRHHLDVDLERVFLIEQARVEPLIVHATSVLQTTTQASTASHSRCSSQRFPSHMGTGPRPRCAGRAPGRAGGCPSQREAGRRILSSQADARARQRTREARDGRTPWMPPDPHQGDVGAGLLVPPPPGQAKVGRYGQRLFMHDAVRLNKASTSLARGGCSSARWSTRHRAGWRRPRLILRFVSLRRARLRF